MSSFDRYASRAEELNSLTALLQKSQNGALIGQVLEAAGDVLRRQQSLRISVGQVVGTLKHISLPALATWAEGIDFGALKARLAEAAIQSVESAIPENDDDHALFSTWAIQGLQSRDKWASALDALQYLAQLKPEAKSVWHRLTLQLKEIDEACAPLVSSFTAVNAHRRAEAQTLDAPTEAWWFSERSGIDDDSLVRTLSGTTGVLRDPERQISHMIAAQRTRKISEEELFRYDSGLANAAEKYAIETAMANNDEWKMISEALKADAEEIEEPRPETIPKRALGRTMVGEGLDVIEARTEFKVLMFKTKNRSQLVVQPLERFAAAAVWHSEDPTKQVKPHIGQFGHHFDLGETAVVGGTHARITVKLTTGKIEVVEVSL
jgi:hypothetical protein